MSNVILNLMNLASDFSWDEVIRPSSIELVGEICSSAGLLWVHPQLGDAWRASDEVRFFIFHNFCLWDLWLLLLRDSHLLRLVLLRAQQRCNRGWIRNRICFCHVLWADASVIFGESWNRFYSTQAVKVMGKRKRLTVFFLHPMLRLVIWFLFEGGLRAHVWKWFEWVLPLSVLHCASEARRIYNEDVISWLVSQNEQA